MVTTGKNGAFGLMALGLALAVSAPALAQSDQNPNSEDASTAYGMSMICLEATMAMAVQAEGSGDTAAYDRLTSDGAIWLEVANNFGEEIGRDARADLDLAVGRLTAEGNLLGEAASSSRQKQVYDACQQFINPPEE